MRMQKWKTFIRFHREILNIIKRLSLKNQFVLYVGGDGDFDAWMESRTYFILVEMVILTPRWRVTRRMYFSPMPSVLPCGAPSGCVFYTKCLAQGSQRPKKNSRYLTRNIRVT